MNLGLNPDGSCTCPTCGAHSLPLTIEKGFGEGWITCDGRANQCPDCSGFNLPHTDWQAYDLTDWQAYDLALKAKYTGIGSYRLRMKLYTYWMDRYAASLPKHRRRPFPTWH